ncbi:MAG TPA: PP2C family protein-serine/threonine phosphatase, partial [Candidatus Binatia bacterium]|nr:PP2C family protein-serine/threonine phosphatase [Candidatus Binatia bacterium]
GCFESFPFTESQAALHPGDLLIVFSDGISEAVNGAGEEFGEARICDLAVANRDQPAAALIEEVFAAVSEHARNQPQMDDMTLVVVKRET